VGLAIAEGSPTGPSSAEPWFLGHDLDMGQPESGVL